MSSFNKLRDLLGLSLFCIFATKDLRDELKDFLDFKLDEAKAGLKATLITKT